MKYLIIVLFLIVPFVLSAQSETLSGYLKDAKNGETLIGATVYIKEKSIGVTTNSYGFYSLTAPRGKYEISFSYIGYQTKSFKVNLNEDKTLNVKLEENSELINEVVVTGEAADANVQSIEMSVSKLPVKTVKKLPAFMGEVDIIKTITLLPGIQSGGEGSSGIYVRGGGPDENLMLLDEAPVYNASHLLGFFSVFNSDAIKDIQVYKGGIPAEYGGKASSVIDIRMKDGNSQHFAATGGIGNISSRLTVEAPIIKDKWSFIASGRRTYADIAGRLAGIDELDGNQLYFYDFNFKNNIQLNEKNRIYISAYSGDDIFKLDESIFMDWGNLTTTARWNHLVSNKLFSNTSFIFSKYDYSVGIPEGGDNAFDWSSHIQDINFKQDFTHFLNTENKLKYGINTIYHQFSPGEIKVSDDSFFSDLELTKYNAFEGAAYVSNEQKINARLSLRYGLRLSYFQQIGEGKMNEYLNPDRPEKDEITGTNTFEKWERIGDGYLNLEPRFSFKFSLDDYSSVKGSYNRMVQNLHLITNTNSPTPFDIWLPSTEYIKPRVANQVAIGYFRNFANNLIETSAETFYKTFNNIIDYKNGAELFLNEDLETEILSGDGYAYGFEFLLKKQQGDLTGWMSYTYSKSMRIVEGINNGNPYPSSYDRTHDFSLVLSYSITPELTLSANWIYSTGNPTSYPVAKYQVMDKTFYHYAARNSYRIPDYHRLDASINYDFKKNRDRRYKQTLNLSFYNIYSRRNAYSVTFRQNEENPTVSEAVRLSIIGSIIPALTYNFSF